MGAGQAGRLEASAGQAGCGYSCRPSGSSGLRLLSVPESVSLTNVGIGTSTPSFALDITGSLANTSEGGVVRFESSGSGDR